jgi:D-serine deaminase-like pyridoxal phosphate-dependent protein
MLLPSIPIRTSTVYSLIMPVDQQRGISQHVAADLRERYDKLTAELDPPLAIADLAAFDRNAADMVRRAGGKPIRIATKSIRCRALIERALATPGYQGLMAYSLPEALWLHTTLTDKTTDILVAYPTADRHALRQLAADDEARQHISIIVDSPEHLDLIDAARDGDTTRTLRVCLDLDVSWRPVSGNENIHIGTRRSPLHTPEQAQRFARIVTQRKGFTLVGVMGYEGQIAGLGNAVPGNRAKSAAIRAIQGRSAPELIHRRTRAIAMIRELADLEFVNGGGTGSLETTSADTSVTELAAGSGLVGPTLFDAYRDFRPRPAVLYALPVVRKPRPDIATLLTGGYVASGTGTKDRLPSPYLPAGLRLTGTEGAGEVQTPVRGEAAIRLHTGDRVWMRHAKAGELAERFTDYHLIDETDQVTPVPTYRGEGQCFGLTMTNCPPRCGSRRSRSRRAGSPCCSPRTSACGWPSTRPSRYCCPSRSSPCTGPTRLPCSRL